MSEHRSIPWATIALAAALAMSLQLIGTARYGAGLSPDSAVYLQSARQLASGNGFTQLVADPGHAPKVVPLTWFPPGYPALLAAVAKLGLNLIQVARYSAAILFGLYVAARRDRGLARDAIDRDHRCRIGRALSGDRSARSVFLRALRTDVIVATLLARSRLRG